MKYGDEEIGGKHIDHANMRFSGDEDKARSYIPIARNLLGELKRGMEFNKLDQDRKQVKLKDGTIISVSSTKGTADTDQILIHSSFNVERPKEIKDRCLGFICRGHYLGPFTDTQVDTEQQGFYVEFRCRTPSKKKLVIGGGNSGSFDNYPDNGAKYGQVGNFIEMSYVFVADQSITETTAITTAGPQQWVYSGPGNSSYSLNPGWTETRDAVTTSGSCEFDTTTAGTYGLLGTLYRAEFGGGNINTGITDKGFGAYYTGSYTYNPLVGCVPDYQYLLASGDWNNQARGDRIAELVTYENSALSEAYNDWLDTAIFYTETHTYKHLNFPPHRISKHQYNKGVVTSFGFYFNNGVFVLSDVRETYNTSISVGGGALFAIPITGESRSFKLSDYVITKNSNSATTEFELNPNPNYDTYYWDTVILDPGGPFWGDVASPIWGGPTSISSATPGLTLTPADIVTNTERVIADNPLTERFGIPIEVEQGTYKVKMFPTAAVPDYKVDKIDVILLMEQQGFRSFTFRAPLNEDGSEFTKDIHIKIGDIVTRPDEVIEWTDYESLSTFYD